jgi:hypothetical protein
MLLLYVTLKEKLVLRQAEQLNSVEIQLDIMQEQQAKQREIK